MLGIGVDMVEISRIAKARARNVEKFPRRILSSQELEEFHDCPNQDSFLAKRFAVKEAVAKALGTGLANGVSWTDISLSHDELGKPIVDLKGGASAQLQRMGGSKALISLSDEAGFVIAYAQIC